jgi:hypothetical protein
LQPECVSVPLTKLVLIQDNLQRAEHAVVCSMASMVDASKKLEMERRRLRSTIEVVANITGVAPTHCT